MALFIYKPARIIVCLCAFIAHFAEATCTLTNVTNSGFDSSDGQSNVAAIEIGTATVNCNGSYRIELNAGFNPSTLRRLSDGAGHFIAYQLWQNSAATQEWGDNGVTYFAAPLNTAGSGNSVIHPIYGSATSNSALAGVYTDTVQVKLTYPPYGVSDQQVANLNLVLRIHGTCNIDTSGINGFGNWQVGANLSNIALGSVSVTCPSGFYYGVGIAAGNNFNDRRHMRNGTNLVPYTLWSKASGNQEWGDQGLTPIDPAYLTTYFAPAQFNYGTGSAQIFYVWGSAETSGVPAGTYEDNVMVTIVW